MTDEELYNLAFVKDDLTVMQILRTIYDRGRTDAIKEVKNGEYASNTRKCPMCWDCPKNCPLERE